MIVFCICAGSISSASCLSTKGDETAVTAIPSTDVNKPTATNNVVGFGISVDSTSGKRVRQNYVKDKSGVRVSVSSSIKSNVTLRKGSKISNQKNFGWYALQ